MPERRHEVTRIEGFSDAVFAFSLTLLVVSLEVPKTTDELDQLVRGSVPFGVMFAMICWIWWEHNKFFRRYGLQDAWTATLNSFLLFVVLFYVYPLKFLTTNLLGPLFGAADAGFDRIANAQLLMLLYSGGIVLIFATLAGLYQHAWRQRGDLSLSPSDEVTLRFGIRSHLLTMGIGVLSMAITLVNGRWAGIAGLIYFLIGPAQAWNGFRSGAAMRALAPAPAATHHAKR